MRISILFVVVSLFSLAACSNSADSNKGEDQNALQQKNWDAMMVVHDEVMPKMGEIHQQIKALKAAQEGMDPASDSREAVTAAIERLEFADDGMMSWMSELQRLGDLRASMDHDAILAYIESETIKVTKVKTDMENSLKGAAEVLAGLTSEQ